MLNLLPQEYKKSLRREYLERFSTVVLALLSFLLVICAVELFPLYLFTNLKYQIVADQLDKVKNSTEAKNKNAVFAVISDLEKKTAAISLLPGEKPTDYLFHIDIFSIPGITINDISYTKKDSTTKKITIEGVAASRTELIALWKKAKSVSWTTASDIALSDLTNEKNIPFTIAFNATSTTP